jgi:hypothetical protein
VSDLRTPSVEARDIREQLLMAFPSTAEEMRDVEAKAEGTAL